MEVKLGKYRHFKGMEVKVKGIVNHSETLEKMVLYEESGKLWVRPVEMFLETIKRDGKLVKRFEFIE